MNRGSSGRVAVAALALLAVAGLGGCGDSTAARRTGHADPGLKPMPVNGGSNLSTAAPARLERGALPQVGDTQRVVTSGSRLAVTLRRVVDPLRGSGAQLPAGTRAVGVIIQISSSGPRVYDSSATGDITVVASDGVVTPVLATHGMCRTPLDDFDRYITAGEDRIGCVVFAVANGATLDAVRFSPHAHRLGRLTWAP